MPGHAWTFAFGVDSGEGIQDHTGVLEDGLVAFAWAVRDGDVASLPPEPEPDPQPTPPPPISEKPNSDESEDGGGAFPLVLLALGIVRLMNSLRRRVASSFSHFQV